nr:glycosyltransferase [Thalassospira lucentensis]
METLAIIVFWVALLLLVHAYGGYAMLLRSLVKLFPSKFVACPVPIVRQKPNVSVLLTVHNEQQHIVPRLENLLSQDYPQELMEIVVASDGSDDHTDDLVIEFAAQSDANIKLISVTGREGKSGAQNHALPKLTNEIVVLTDAAARFAPDFIARIVAPFADDTVGCAVGRVAFSDEDTGVSRGMRRYWRTEMALRETESRLGILAVASGQAMAFRKSLFRPLPLHVGDDCIIPLDVVASGARVVHVQDALTYDEAESGIKGELRSRARMTARNWVGTWRHPALLSPFGHPGYAFSLWSHKLLRWLSPVLLASLFVAALFMADRPFYGAIACISSVGLALAGIGWAAEARLGHGQTVPHIPGLSLAQFAFAFFLAQMGFFWGLWIAVRGQRIRAYKT